MASLATVSSSATQAHAPAAFFVRVAGSLAQAWKAWRNRREFHRLDDMSDAELADIGLTRADLSVATGLPLGVDPTAHLGAIASSRIRSIADGARLVA